LGGAEQALADVAMVTHRSGLVPRLVTSDRRAIGAGDPDEHAAVRVDSGSRPIIHRFLSTLLDL
jgi:hypothetical protein